MNTLFKALLALLAILVVAAVAVTVFARKSGATVGEETTSYVEETTVPVEESATVEDTSESTPERTTVKEEISKLDISYEATTVFETKQLKRKFKGQDDRFKIYKKIFEENFDPKTADVFFYDITHDGKADMLVLTPIINEDTKKTVGRILQLFTITGEKQNTVTEIFRDFGGINTTGSGFSCYVTEQEGEDCLLIIKDEMDEGAGRLSYRIVYVVEDGTVITKASSHYNTPEGMDYDTEAAFNYYSEQLDAQLISAHTTLFDYRHPKAVSSKAEKAFKDYIK
ncbi:MAG: hypothetical protein IJA02_07550 [Clostridia bacterium]|nr:hypothetical protein [Clostridia bacterium]MBR6620104.1 hypothetical protein [Clostridia bacterium]